MSGIGIVEDNLFKAMDKDPTDRTVLLALADWHEERNMDKEARIWRLIHSSDREPLHDEHTRGQFWWRHGCFCSASLVLSGNECVYLATPDLNHARNRFIIGPSLISDAHSLCKDMSHPLFGASPYGQIQQGSIRAFPSRSKAFRFFLSRLLELGI